MAAERVLPREQDEARLRTALGRAPVVLVTGARQTGKSTPARKVVAPSPSHVFDLEDPRDAARLAEPTLSLVLASASPDLVGLSAESLAGRVALVELGGFRVSDVGATETDVLWERGGLPRSYLAADDETSAAWRDDYISTFLERDLANLGIRLPATTMRRFWTMLAHFHGQTWNGAELARALGFRRRPSAAISTR